MGHLDITLRDTLQEIPKKFVEILTGKKAIKLLETQFPSQERRADLILELDDGSIFHLELQTIPDENMPYRMLEYYTLIKRKHKDKPIKQMVLYVGDKKPDISSKIEENNLKFEYELIDIKVYPAKNY